MNGVIFDLWQKAPPKPPGIPGKRSCKVFLIIFRQLLACDSGIARNDNSRLKSVETSTGCARAGGRHRRFFKILFSLRKLLTASNSYFSLNSPVPHRAVLTVNRLSPRSEALLLENWQQGQTSWKFEYL